MNQKAEAANTAADTGQSGTLFQIIKDLTQVKEHRRSFGFRRDAYPQEEAEAWKEHFAQIQAGVGDIPDEVWQDVNPEPVTADWLSSPQPLKKFRKPFMTPAMAEPPARTHSWLNFSSLGVPSYARS